MDQLKLACHCGRVVARISMPPLSPETRAVVACNCSICTKHALAIRYCKRDDITFEAGEDTLQNYMCGNRTRVMTFCGTCAVVVLFDAHGGGSESERDTVVAVNVRAIEGYDPYEVVFEDFDGASVPVAL